MTRPGDSCPNSVDIAVQTRRGWVSRLIGPGVLLAIFLMACGGAATATPTSRLPTSTPTPTQEPTATTSAQEVATTGLRWQRVNVSGTAPEARRDATLVYDDAGNRLLLFGGRQKGQGLNDLWSYDLDSGGWTEITAPGGPEPRWGHIAEFDSKRGQIVVFSGQRSGGFFNDTWVFDMTSQEWKQVTPGADVPTPRYGSCSGYDSENDVLYISHGFTNSGRFDDTWAFDLAGQSWTEVSASDARPIKRCLHRCAFDPETNSLLLFGGQSNVTPILGDLWSYDPSRKEWTELLPEGETPMPRFLSSMVRDQNSKRLLLFGGSTLDGREDDLWSYTQNEGWAKLGPEGASPEARNSHAGTFVSDTGSYYMFGGTGGEDLGDLWLLRAG